MELVSKTHKEVPYGWVTWAATALHWIRRTLSASPGLRDERAAALEHLSAGLNRPSGPH
jgi:hypothetical protein